MYGNDILYLSLKELPSFTKLEKGWAENSRYDSKYIEHFLPEKEGFSYVTDECPPQKYKYRLSSEEQLVLAQECLLGDNKGWFAEFIHDDNLREDVSEFMRDILRLIHERH